MAKRIDYEGIVGLIYTNKKGQRYKVLSWDKNGSQKVVYEVGFIDDKGNIIKSVIRGKEVEHIYGEIGYKSVINGTVKDVIQNKFDAKKKKAAWFNRQFGSKRSKENYKRIANLKQKVVLAVDGATYTTGLALYRPNKPISSKIVQADKDDDIESRINVFVNVIEGIINTYNVDVVYYEEPLLKNKNSTFKLGALHTAVENSVKLRGKEFIAIVSTSWKSYCGLTMKAPKGAKEGELSKIQKKESIARAEALLGRKVASDDEADAYNMLTYCLERLGKR